MTEKFDVTVLAQFTGTTVWYKHCLLKNITYTEGVKYLAETAGAYWLIDEIAFGQVEKRIADEAFQLWTLKVDKQQAATLTCEDGNGIVVHEKLIEYTDFPLVEIKLYYTNNVIMLPSEY